MKLFEFETNEVKAVAYYYPERQFGERAYCNPPYEIVITDIATGVVEKRTANNSCIIESYLDNLKAHVTDIAVGKRMEYQGYTRSNPFGRWEKTRKAEYEK